MPRRHPKPDRRGRGAPPRRDEGPDLARQAELAARRRENCAKKARYATEAEARSHALMHTGGLGPRPKAYRCDVCDGWHFTRG